jgi:hypothetical protein
MAGKIGSAASPTCRRIFDLFPFSGDRSPSFDPVHGSQNVQNLCSAMEQEEPMGRSIDQSFTSRRILRANELVS